MGQLHASQLTSAVGTHEYMSPESLRLAEDELLGIRSPSRTNCAACSEAYALGVTLYVSLIGTYPAPWFDRRLSTLGNRRLPPYFVKQCNISSKAQQLIASMMQYEPGHRVTGQPCRKLRRATGCARTTPRLSPIGPVLHKCSKQWERLLKATRPRV